MPSHGRFATSKVPALNSAEAKAIARAWVLEQASTVDAAFLTGSSNWRDDDAIVPPWSDVDVWLVLNSGQPPRAGKFRHRGVLLDVSSLMRDRLPAPDDLLGDYHLAPAFSRSNVIFDRSGELTELQKVIAAQFTRRSCVLRRVEHARANVLRYTRSLSDDLPLHDQAISWAFASGVLTHVLLTAALRNPTVRTRYAATRDLLEARGNLDFYEELLGPLGCRTLDRPTVERHLASVERVFDVAKGYVKTMGPARRPWRRSSSAPAPLPFASDITDDARPVAIDGSRNLIERGLHREAIFWIVVTFARCQKILEAEAPAEYERFDIRFCDLLRDLGIESFADLLERCAGVEAMLTRVQAVAEDIIAANPDIRD